MNDHTPPSPEEGWKAVLQPLIKDHVPQVAVVEVVRVTYGRGAGVVGDPYRHVHGYFSAKGELLAEHDTFGAHDALRELRVAVGELLRAIKGELPAFDLDHPADIGISGDTANTLRALAQAPDEARRPWMPGR